MTLSPGEVERKVRQHDDDIAEIYEIVTDVQRVQTRHTQRLSKTGTTADRVEARLDGLETRLDGHDARFDDLAARLDGHDARFDAVDARFDAVDARLVGIDEQLVEVLTLLRSQPWPRATLVVSASRRRCRRRRGRSSCSPGRAAC